MNERILEKNFFQLKIFIEACLGLSESISDTDRRFLTKDRKVLLSYAERLSLLYDAPTLGVEIPQFRSWPKPHGIPSNLIDEQLARHDQYRFENYQREIKEFKAIISDIRKVYGTGRAVITDIYDKIGKITHHDINQQITKLPWVVLPEGTSDRFLEIIKHYKSLEESNPNVKYDIDRLEKVFSLNAEKIYVGIEEFEGYIVFYFERSSTAVLECPIHGNAIYVLQRNWASLSKLSKAALLGEHKNHIQRIVHNGNWFSRLEWLLKSREGRANIRY